MKLLSMRRSTQPGKKYTVVLDTGEGRTKTIHFGDASMKDYTLFTAEERAERKRAYLSRHASREDWSDPTTAGFWSRHILWGDTPSVAANLKLTRRRYNL
jgi:hypothetical protein